MLGSHLAKFGAMRIAASGSRLRATALIVTISSFIAFVLAQQAGGSLSSVLAVASLMLFGAEIVLGIVDHVRGPDEAPRQ